MKLIKINETEIVNLHKVEVITIRRKSGEAGTYHVIFKMKDIIVETFDFATYADAWEWLNTVIDPDTIAVGG